MTLLRALWRIVVLLFALVALGLLLVFTALAAPFVLASAAYARWRKGRMSRRMPDIPLDLWTDK